MNENGKKAAGRAAAELVENGMTIGLGTGTTVRFFLERLAERCKEGLKISTVSSSKQSTQLAASLHIPSTDIDSLIGLDLTVDGADEIDEEKNMIKGGGGALLREKIIANMSREMVVIVDASKCVTTLGSNFPLPIEILPFAWCATLHQLNTLGLKGHLRVNNTGLPYLTDNNNYIYDVLPDCLRGDLKQLNVQILMIPGVIETGFFFGLAKQVIVGYPDGKIAILN